jgi:hypothetical protein
MVIMPYTKSEELDENSGHSPTQDRLIHLRRTDPQQLEDMMYLLSKFLTSFKVQKHLQWFMQPGGEIFLPV